MIKHCLRNYRGSIKLKAQLRPPYAIDEEDKDVEGITTPCFMDRIEIPLPLKNFSSYLAMLSIVILKLRLILILYMV